MHCFGDYDEMFQTHKAQEFRAKFINFEKLQITKIRTKIQFFNFVLANFKQKP